MVKILVIGCGSIGGRHIRNLKSLGVDVYVHDVNQESLGAIISKYNLRGFTNIEDVFKEGVDGVIIASPSKFHYSQAVKVIESGIPVFIEKPMTTSLKEAILLEEFADKNNAIVVNGFNMRFHPSIKKVKKMLEDDLIGRVYSIRAMAGYYLPDWHPQNDYRKSYSANKSLGGGVLLDGIHELDYIKSLFGEITHVYCLGGKVSNLEIDTEDMAEILMKCSGGIIAELHVNYLNRARLREFVIVGENGIIGWDSNKGTVRHYDPKIKCWKEYREEFEYHINDTYVLEMKHFINCIIGKEKSINDAKEGRFIIQVVECAKESMKTGQQIVISEYNGTKC
jgi:predicted dehydrogenase